MFVSKKTKKHAAIDVLFQPNKEGISRWVTREEIDNNPILRWGNNGNARHGSYFGDKRFVWEKQQISRKITHLRTNGLNNNNLIQALRPIRKDIHSFHKAMGCVVCGSHSDLVTDHKNDLYNDQRVLDSDKQTFNDFQCLCNHCNLQKRQVAKITRETGKRYKATNIPSLMPFGIDFIKGDETFNPEDPNAMVGTYWYDPIEFMKQIKNSK